MMKKVKVHYPPFINWWIPKLLIKQFFCKHEWGNNLVFTGIRCNKCGKIKPNQYYDDTLDKLVREEFKDGD
jgi:hypothetical protein